MAKEKHRIGFVRAVAWVRNGIEPADIDAKQIRILGHDVLSMELPHVPRDDEDWEWNDRVSWQLWERYVETTAKLAEIRRRIWDGEPPSKDEPDGWRRREIYFRNLGLEAAYEDKLEGLRRHEDLDTSKAIYEARRLFIERAEWIELDD